MAVTAELSLESPTSVAAADRDSSNASLTLALAQPGDTLLYMLLPLHHDEFGVSLAEAGLLLAANRLVRIDGHGWVARFYAERGPKASSLLAVAGAALATFGYALCSGATQRSDACDYRGGAREWTYGRGGDRVASWPAPFLVSRRRNAGMPAPRFMAVIAERK